MSLDQSKAYELLGVKPGVSNRELKAAHRDLAKVWHPDRFLHDPRLQEKAQEKLKEINEAYELLISGKTPRPSSPPLNREPNVQTSRGRRQGATWQWAVVLLLFAAVFAITTRTLIQRRNVPVALEETPAAAEQSVAFEQEQPARPDAIRKSNKPDQQTTIPTSETVATEPTPAPAVDTVTVTIDPESGLLAKS
ncbi:MAG TPA: J domain-containing protein, partial [Pyrinomonadaceae bacterium]|nr:J domain-containing protein [Pyrinomonadaceae bacterium]